jgi:hypothetical protein
MLGRGKNLPRLLRLFKNIALLAQVLIFLVQASQLALLGGSLARVAGSLARDAQITGHFLDRASTLQQSHRALFEFAIVTTCEPLVFLHWMFPFYSESPVRKIEETSHIK